jgi:V8-like Glu-specific endopeptidase
MSEPELPRTLQSRSLLQRLGGGNGSLESTTGQGPDLSKDRIAQSLEMLEKVLAHNVVENTSTTLGAEDANAFLINAREGLARLAHDGVSAKLALDHVVGLEAVIETDGSRPSLLIRNGWIDENDPRLAPWLGEVSSYAHAIQTAIRATGRLIVNGDISNTQICGTVFMVAPGLAATAKHVVEQTFVQDPAGNNDWFVREGDHVEVDFHVEADSPPQPDKRIQVTGVHWASPDTIGTMIQRKNLDFALLQLAEVGPPHLETTDTLPGQNGPPRLHVIGHPERGSLPKSVALAEAGAYYEIIDLIFGAKFGVKRWSPGHLEIGPGNLRGDRTNKRIMTHDASTLPGNSGAPVLDLTNIADRVVGLHYGGYFQDQNYAHGGPNFMQTLRDAVVAPSPSDDDD